MTLERKSAESLRDGEYALADVFYEGCMTTRIVRRVGNHITEAPNTKAPCVYLRDIEESTEVMYHKDNSVYPLPVTFVPTQEVVV
jgi:hypothetical protein